MTHNKKSNSVNAGLTVMCNEKDVRFANSDPYFVFSDGSIKAGYIETDGRPGVCV